MILLTLLSSYRVAIGSKGTSTKGTALFGGDVVTSGTLYPNEIKTSKISGSLTHLSDGSSYLVAGSNITISSGSNGSVTITSTGAGAADAVGWIAPAPSVISTSGSVFFGVTGGSTEPDITFGANGAANFNVQETAIDFRVASDNKSHALFIDGSSDQVLILSGGNSASYNEAEGADVAFYVSGTVNSAGTSTRGTSLFGGGPRL